MTDPIGHNKPPFDPAEIVDLESLPEQLRRTYGYKFDRKNDLIKACNAWLLSFSEEGAAPVFKDKDAAAEATDRLAIIKAEIDACHGKENSVHTTAKAPFLKGGRIVDQILNAELVDPLRAAADAISKPLLAYHKKAAEEERARLKREAEQAAAEAARLAAIAAANARTEEDLEAAMEAEQAALESASISEAVKPSLVRGDYNTSSGLRGKWKPVIRNVDLIPRQYMVVSVPMLEAAGKTLKDKSGRPLVEIPGVEWEWEATLATRR